MPYLSGLEPPSGDDYNVFLQWKDLGPWGPRSGYCPFHKADAERYMELHPSNIYVWDGQHWALREALP